MILYNGLVTINYILMILFSNQENIFNLKQKTLVLSLIYYEYRLFIRIASRLLQAPSGGIDT